MQATINSAFKHKRMTVAMLTIIAAVALFVAGCDRPVLPHSQFIHLPDAGWMHKSPLTFQPVYDDSTRTYDILLVVRHHSSYAYGTLPLAVDIIAADSTVQRQSLGMRLADEHGNWTGGGFGPLYQRKMSVARGVMPSEACRVMVWQAVDSCDCLTGIADIGIICKPSSK